MTNLTAKGSKSSSGNHKQKKELTTESSLAIGKQEMPSDPKAKPSKSPSKLTARELEIVRFLALGKSSKQIAHLLQISCRTVDTHRANCMRKLSLHSVTELLHFVLTNKLIGMDGGIYPPNLLLESSIAV